MQKLKDEIKKKIIEVGKYKFKKEGYENTSMKDIASDAGISTGNIYRYFLTKKHLLAEILSELETDIESFFDAIPSNYDDLDIDEIFKSLVDMTVKLASEKNDTLKVMFNCENESQFISFKERVLEYFVQKMSDIVKSLKSKEVDYTVCRAIARANFEGYACILKANIDNVDMLRKDLAIYQKLMVEGIKNKVMEVVKK